MKKPHKKPGPGKGHGLSTGRRKLPPGVKRPRLSCTVAPQTLETFKEIAARTPGGNIGRVLDELAASGAPQPNL